MLIALAKLSQQGFTNLCIDLRDNSGGYINGINEKNYSLFTDLMQIQEPAVRLQLGDGTIYEKEGRIESISGVLDRQTGSGSLRAVFPNAERVLLSGSTGNILIPQTLQDAIPIPQEATYELQDKLFVYRVVNGKAVATRIEVNPVHDGIRYTVTSGLDVGDVIVTTGVGLLNNGDAVTLKP